MGRKEPNQNQKKIKLNQNQKKIKLNGSLSQSRFSEVEF